MKKSDLKVGYLVITEDDFKNIIMPSEDGLILIDEKERWFGIKALRDDLSSGIANCSIIKVYGLPKNISASLRFEISSRKLLWEKDEKKEMTIKEIEKVLGYPIKIVKEN